MTAGSGSKPNQEIRRSRDMLEACSKHAPSIAHALLKQCPSIFGPRALITESDEDASELHSPRDAPPPWYVEAGLRRADETPVKRCDGF